MDTTVLGQGVLGWPAEERHSDRYGLIHLNAIPDTGHFTPLPFDTALVGAHGRLVAVVLDTRLSPHIGDFACAVGPAMPTVGEEITLGIGTLFVVPWRWGFSLVGVKPDEDRSHDWMDPAALYRCHHQTVRLELRYDATLANHGRCYGSSYPARSDWICPSWRSGSWPNWSSAPPTRTADSPHTPTTPPR